LLIYGLGMQIFHGVGEILEIVSRVGNRIGSNTARILAHCIEVSLDPTTQPRHDKFWPLRQLLSSRGKVAEKHPRMLIFRFEESARVDAPAAGARLDESGRQKLRRIPLFGIKDQG